MKRISGKEWFYLMVKAEGKYTLFDKHPQHKLNDKLIVSLQKKFNDTTTRLFAVFDTYIDFYGYQQSIAEEDRCFYELILGDSHQKPHFDLDMNLDEDPDGDMDKVISHLVDAIVRVMTDMKRNISLTRNIVICTSHGKNKKSAHLVIDGYCHRNHKEAAEFYNMVVEHVPLDLVKYIDLAVYSSKQQFRMLGSQKSGSGRIKKFATKWKHHGRVIVHDVSTISRSIDKGMLFLSKSLVSVTQGCSLLLVETSKPKPMHFQSDHLSNSQVEEVKKVIASNIPDFDLFFSYRGVSSVFISLQTKKSYQCRACYGIHNRENPYILVKSDGSVEFRCRRTGRGVNIGRIFSVLDIPISPSKGSGPDRGEILQLSDRSSDVSKDPKYNDTRVQHALLGLTGLHNF